MWNSYLYYTQLLNFPPLQNFIQKKSQTPFFINLGFTIILSSVILSSSNKRYYLVDNYRRASDFKDSDKFSRRGSII
jgi:hypothetical protein